MLRCAQWNEGIPLHLFKRQGKGDLVAQSNWCGSENLFVVRTAEAPVYLTTKEPFIENTHTLPTAA